MDTVKQSSDCWTTLRPFNEYSHVSRNYAKQLISGAMERYKSYKRLRPRRIKLHKCHKSTAYGQAPQYFLLVWGTIRSDGVSIAGERIEVDEEFTNLKNKF